MLFDRIPAIVAATVLVLGGSSRAQVFDTLISNYGQPNQLPNVDLYDQSQRIAWDFTTGADAYSDLFLTVQASNNDGGGRYLTAEFFTSASSAPDTLVGSLQIRVGFTEGTFQDFSNDLPAAVSLAANTTYWVVLSLTDPLNNVGPPGILFRNIADGTTDAGGIYSSVSGTSLLTSSNNGSTWAAQSGTDAVKYLLEGIKAVLVVPVVPPDAVLTAQSLQSLALQSTSALLEDFAMRLFRARSGQGGNASQNTVLVDLAGEDEQVVLGEGDGPGSPPRIVGLTTGARAGQLRIFSSFDYGYAGLSSASSLRSNTYGGTLGMELTLTDHLSLGAGLGALTAQTRVSGGIASINTDGLTLASYATYQRGGTYLDLLYAATMLDNRVMRAAALSSPDSTVHTVQFNTGHNFTSGRFTHGPFVGVNYAHANTNPYTENGPGAVTVDRQRSDTMQGRVGWQGSAQFDRGWGVIIPQVRLSWDKQYLNDTSAANVALAGVPGVVTRTSTGGASQNGLGLGAGVMLSLNRGWAFGLNYQGHMLDGAANLHNAMAYASYRW
ncbi:autotransporter domain-containing protein [Prosthecobacter fluviatilis]|uniref:Autotransporter domain-containing protein n=1 Tax=Prosthecobacter fluviatilis TaxID=445931 RepID=A0ABW0KQB8_9BACT